MTTHELKCWPKFWDPLRFGTKNFEVRKNDRNFKEGDPVIFEEWDPETGGYTGRRLHRVIRYILRPDEIDAKDKGVLHPDYVILAL